MKRDIRIDTIRGLFMVWMTINHLGGPLHAYSFQTLGFFSSAEGFVFISGIVAGMVYGRMGLTKGGTFMKNRVFHRALDIYWFHLATFVLVMAVENSISNQTYASVYRQLNPLPMESPLIALGLGALFLWQPAFLDILPMYCLFLLITPFCLNGFKNKQSHWVLLGSLLVWVSATYHSWDRLQQFLFRYLPCNLGFFHPLAWQFLFIGGLFFGFRRAAGYSVPVKKYWIISSLVIWIGILLLRYEALPARILGFDLMTLTLRESFGLLRVINLMVLAYLLTCLGSRWPRLLEWPWFSYLGQHSLQVFSFQLVLLYVVLPLYNNLIPHGWIVIIGASILIVSTLTIPAWLHVKYRQVRTSVPL